jgi:hypothetical protein
MSKNPTSLLLSSTTKSKAGKLIKHNVAYSDIIKANLNDLVELYKSKQPISTGTDKVFIIR